ncbi:hypothetical protein POM88_019519 [Heracleum sosnowskyi]|uniref:Protein transport protein SEC23 n=1 Tax=Heracleum sosnowskyi TaxID=360622 RepID=A0AAD8MR77_9APIA|nr:hypothetical protein POM88_019519 [Heracleum sosnowskyi]
MFLLNELYPKAPVFVFVLDTCMAEEELGFAKLALMRAIGLLPENALVGFVSFGTQVQVHELGFGEMSKVRRPKRMLEELESTAESHPPMLTSKRARTDKQIMSLGPIKFHKEVLHGLFVEMNKARCYLEPYGDLNLQWEDDALWETIISNLKLPVLLSVHEFKLNLMGYYEAFESNTLSNFTNCQETLSLIRGLFLPRREGLVDHLASCQGLFFLEKAPCPLIKTL